MDVKSAAVLSEDFESQFEPPEEYRFGKFSRDWTSGKIESI